MINWAEIALITLICAIIYLCSIPPAIIALLIKNGILVANDWMEKIHNYFNNKKGAM